MTSKQQDRDPDPVAATEAGHYSASFELSMDPQSAHQARHTVRELLSTWHVDAPDLRYDVLLVTSELVTNAVRHGTDRVTLYVSLDPEQIVVAVEDGSPTHPERPLHVADDQDQAIDKETGRGVTIVSAVASEWGIDQLPDGGKRVWVRLPRTPALPPQRTPGADPS
ncbi:MAG: ATP-binding protein [Frankiaceae bacterium]|nr:ATP-binding protein [Frankiaceae bacterium]